MANQRKAALEAINSRSVMDVEYPSGKFSEYFEENTFGLKRMEERLSTEEFKAIKDAMKKGTKIDQKTANAIAVAVKNWAVNKGVTHFAHWFQPLTNLTAVKFDTFYNSKKKVEEFKGSVLVQQEPDGSSFPNGGLRATHTARGYTGWDPTSPMFIYNNSLYIPTVFVSYTGETLDNKSPLLKAQRAVDMNATAVAKIFDYKVDQVFSSLGCEQEYFLVDRALYNARPDLVMGGRTVFGAASPRGQQQDDHYFGHIHPRVVAFMKELEVECMKVGIPITTRHNEVAPGQFELAPLYEDINVASDHNALTMDIMDDVAAKHGFKALLHEKPFAGLNGSGKHNNWSLIADTGRNLIDPSFTTKKDGLYFLTFLVNTIKAMHDYADVVRGSIASAGNDHRLGANEAPPAIISVFLGEVLDGILNEFEATGEFKTGKEKKPVLDLLIERIPDLKLDNTDRNRTSPFAFTGNKFELRAVGSTASCAKPMTALNTVVAEQLSLFKDEFDAAVKGGQDKDDAIVAILRKYITESKNIRFEGDGYSDEWVAEAEKRGLSNVKDTPRALDFYADEKVNEIFAKHGVYKLGELGARQEVWLENYINKIDIESKVMEEIALNQILPVANEQLSLLIDNAAGLADLGIDNSAAVGSAKEVADLINTVKTNVASMVAKRNEIEELEETREIAIQFCDVIKGEYFENIRGAADALELLVDDAAWPLPKYRELLFLK